MSKISPLTPTTMSVGTAGPEMASLALARVSFDSRTVKSLYAEALAVGFVRKGNDLHHPDGSWLTVDQRGQTYIGYRETRYLRAPVPAFDRPVGDVPARSAAAKVPATVAASVKKQHEALLALGFTLAGPSYYVHPDNSWVSVVGRSVIAGVAEVRRAPPTGVPRTVESSALLPVQPATFAHVVYAAMTAPQCANVTGARKAFRPLGFVERSPGYFEHADTSWIAVSPAGTRRGVGDTRLRGLPVAQGTRPLAEADLRRGFANPALFGLSAAQVRSDDPRLAAAGLSKLGPGVWEASDRSFIAAIGDEVRFGHFNQWVDAPPTARNLPLAPLNSFNLTGTVALHGIDPNDLAALPAALLKAGFGEERPGYFVRERCLWVSVESGGVFVGTHLGRLQHWPDPNHFPVRRPVASDAFKILRHTLGVRPETAVTELTALGFRRARDNFFVHTDASWVLLQAGLIFRGIGDAVVSAPPSAPKRGQLATYKAVPSATWQWFRENTALGNTPLLDNSANSRTALERLGYKKKVEGQRERWLHPACGSWVIFEQGSVSLGWQGFALGALPFNERMAR